MEELIQLLGDHESYCFLAGGTDLIVRMRAALVRPSLVIDIKRIPELSAISVDSTGLRLGAAANCWTIYQNSEIENQFPALIDSVKLIGGTSIQGRATVGGNLCNAAPSGDSIPTLIALSASAHIIGRHTQREIPIENFCISPGENALGKEELLVSINIPTPSRNSGARFLRFIPRNEMDIAVVSVAAHVELNEKNDSFVSGRIAVGSSAPTPFLAGEAGNALAGMPVSDRVIKVSASIAREMATPISDKRGDADQRRKLVEVLTIRAINDAVSRARGLNL
jgi:carbon-monoxide dehydrogenase medium subunit